MKLFARNRNNTEVVFIAGEDRQFKKKALESTGAFFLDKETKFAYDSIPDTMGAYTSFDKKGKFKHLGQCCLLFETSAQPYDFKNAKWTGYSPNVTNLLSDGRMEGMGAVADSLEDEARLQKLMPFMWAGFALLTLVTLIACIAGGLFQNVKDAF